MADKPPAKEHKPLVLTPIESVRHACTNVVTQHADPLERIATALERIAAQLDHNWGIR